MNERLPGRLLGLALAATASLASAQQPASSERSATPALRCAFPTSPAVLVERQPDGSEIELVFRGGAERQWYEDPRGYPVLRDRGRYVYALLDRAGALVPTRLAVGRVDPATVGGLLANVRPSAPGRPERGKDRRPAIDGDGSEVFGGGAGRVENLVVLLRFSDHGPGGQDRTLPTAEDVTRIMNAVGGDGLLAPTGSVRDHYLETSYGQLVIDSTVVGWLPVPGSETYYADGSSGLGFLTWDLITDGLVVADAAIDFRDFDRDQDGKIDAITFLHSGYGAEWGGTDQYGTYYFDRIWSHKWEIPTWTSAEGVTVSEYNISPGLWGTSGSGPGRIGVVVHELGHYFGLPDLYDTGGGSQGIGNWGIMAGGSWGFDGSQRHPAHPSAWSKLKMGWVEPERVFPGTYVAPQVETNRSIFLLQSGYPTGEYLLLENREPVGFETVIPQGGIAIWHVDEGKGAMGYNDPNTDEGHPGQLGWPQNGRHYRNALLQADGGYDMERNLDRGDQADTYHGGGGVNAITNATTPSTSAYQGGDVVANGNAITVLSGAGSRMSFRYTNAAKPFVNFSTIDRIPVGRAWAVPLTANGGTGELTWSEHRAEPSYWSRGTGTSGFAAVGVARGWRGDEQVWVYDLPFSFPFWEDDYRRVYVSSNGFLDFHPIQHAEAFNQKTHLKFSARIAPLWDDLDLYDVGDDVYVDESVLGQVTIRWQAHTYATFSPCNFSVTLRRDGRITFHYGPGNTSLTPTVGISRGLGADVLLVPGLDGATSLENAGSHVFRLVGSELPPGLFVDGDRLVGSATQAGVFRPILRVTDANHVYDERAITIETFVDPNPDLLPLAPIEDCNGNGIADELDADCNANGVPDDCDIAAGTSEDIDGNGVPDDCQVGSRALRDR